MKTLLTRVGVIAGAGLFALGCAGPRMVPPDDVAQKSQTLEVGDRSAMSGALANESFKLGAFEVADVDRDWNKKSGFSVGGFSNDTTTSGYSYNLKGGGDSWAGSCASQADKEGVKILGGEAAWGKTRLTCECKKGPVTAVVQLDSKQPDSSTKGMGGELNAGGAKYKVTAVTSTDKTNLSGSPAGFRFDGDDGAVGAVEILRPGRVWLNERLPESERPPVACLSAGLMLYVPPSEH
jgi:hypothetical protein